VELTPIDVRDPCEIDAIAAFARERNGGLIVTASPSSVTHRNLIISLATRYRLPNVYAFRYYPAIGGLASYGPDTIDEYKRAAGYVDRILKGEKPADLPVQAPTKYAPGDQFQDRQDGRPHYAAVAAGTRGRSDRIEMSYLLHCMSPVVMALLGHPGRVRARQLSKEPDSRTESAHRSPRYRRAASLAD